MSGEDLRTETIEQLARRLDSDRRRVWGYVRVSSQKQADNESIPAQQEAIRLYCTSKSLESPGFVVEVASAAKPLFVVNLPGAPKQETSVEASPRPKLLLLFSHLREITGSHLVIWKLDRLARIDYEQELFLNMLRQDKVTTHSVQPGEAHMLDGGHVNDPARVFSRQVLAAAAQYERALTDLRMKSGITFKAARGGFTGGIAPYGYDNERKELVVFPEEAKMVRFIFWLNKRYQMGPSAVWEHINSHKAPTAPHFPLQKVGRILRNKALYQGNYKDCFGTVHMRPDLRILPLDDEELDDEFTK